MDIANVNPEFLIIALSALLASVGYIAQVRGRRLEIRRQALFYLFEMRRAVLQALVSPDEVAKEFDEILKNLIIDKFGIKEEGIPSDVNKEAHAHLGNMVDAATVNLDADFQSGYKSCLRQLSKEKPYTASYLMGSERTGSILEVQKQYIKSIKKNDLFQTGEEGAEYVVEKFDDANKLAVKEILHDLNNDIRLLARWSGFLIWFGSCQVTKKNDPIKQDFKDTQMMKELDVMLDEMASQVRLNNEVET